MKAKFREFLTFICTLAAFVSSVIIICTFLTTYQFLYVGQLFNSYLIMQISIGITMAIWALRFFLFQKGRERYIYTSICCSIALVFMLFLVSGIK